jgi:putative hydrolase of the HAD superfamily
MVAHPRTAVSLDALGTLVELEPPAPRLVRALARRGVEVGLAAAERAFAAEIAYYVEHHLEGFDPASLDALRDRCAAVLGESLGVSGVREPMLESLRFRAFSDAAPTLRELRSRGMALVVVSNWDCALPGVLDDAGLLGLVDWVVSSAVVGAAKPDPAPLRRGLELAGAAAASALHVGDSPDKDLAAARAAGIRGLVISRDGGGDIRSLAELAYLV